MDNITEPLNSETEARIEALEQRALQHETRIARLEDSMSILRTDVVEIKTTLSSLATKADLSNMVNGLLREALNAVPLRQTVIWTALAALAAAATVAVAMHR